MGQLTQHTQSNEHEFKRKKMPSVKQDETPFSNELKKMSDDELRAIDLKVGKKFAAIEKKVRIELGEDARNFNGHTGAPFAPASKNQAAAQIEGIKGVLIRAEASRRHLTPHSFNNHNYRLTPLNAMEISKYERWLQSSKQSYESIPADVVMKNRIRLRPKQS